MTDHKASIKIEFSIYGVTEKMNAWINWSPDSGQYPIDQRVIDFFVVAYEKARAVYDEENEESESEERQRAVEQEERAELSRLKAKYEHAHSAPGSQK